jgi:hypothetical protein
VLDARNEHAPIAREVRADAVGIVCFLPEVHLVANAQRELLDRDAQSADVRIRREPSLEQSENALGGSDIGRDQPLDPRPEHLHDDVAPLIDRTMHLPERCRGYGHGLEALEQLSRAFPVALDNGALDRRERNRRDLVGEGREGGDVLLGKQVRASGEHLGELHEGGTERPDGRDEPLGASSMELVRAHQGRARDDPASAVTKK